MAVRLITYDLNKELDSEDYKKILKVIKGYAWARLSESSYAIQTSEYVSTVYAKLKPYLDKNDNLLVLTLTRPYAGYHKTKVIQWLKSKLPQ